MELTEDTRDKLTIITEIVFCGIFGVIAILNSGEISMVFNSFYIISVVLIIPCVFLTKYFIWKDFETDREEKPKHLNTYYYCKDYGKRNDTKRIKLDNLRIGFNAMFNFIGSYSHRHIPPNNLKWIINKELRQKNNGRYNRFSNREWKSPN